MTIKKIIAYLDEETGHVYHKESLVQPGEQAPTNVVLWWGPGQQDWDYLEPVDEPNVEAEVVRPREVLDTAAISRLTREANCSVDEVIKLREAGLI